MTLTQANTDVAALTIEGISGWRLPTVGELLSIVDYEQSEGPTVAALNPNFFQPEAGFGLAVWTSTPYGLDTTRQWQIDMLDELHKLPELFDLPRT